MTNIKDRARKNIRYYRMQKDLTQLQLGLEAKMDASHIGRIERGEIDIMLPTLEKIAEALDISVGKLLEEPPEEDPPSEP